MYMKKKKGVLIMISVAINIILIVLYLRNYQGCNEIVINYADNKKDRKVTVDIQGELKKPGVYTLKFGKNINDAIEKAGGLTENADIEVVGSTVNRAERLKDEQKIYISAKDNSNNIQEKVKININLATQSELETLPGIGITYAGSIIEERPYASIEDIKRAHGIGDATYEKIKDLIAI